MIMKIKDIMNSKTFRNILAVAACLVVLVLVFSAGVFVGNEKAKFSYGWGENYYHNFVDPDTPLDAIPGIQDPFWGKNYMTPHGLLGQIIEIDNGGFVMTGSNQAEVPVEVGDKTIFKDRHSNLKFSDLKIGERAVVIGAPGQQGEIDAKFVRIEDNFLH
jgi:hypothetical protein